MNTQHTPGPWEVAGARVGKPKYGEIAECFGSDFEANARLIAIAPELTDALRLALQALNTAPRFNVSEDMDSYDIAAICQETLNKTKP